MFVTYEDEKKMKELGDKEIHRIGKKRLVEWSCAGPWPVEPVIICKTLVTSDNEPYYNEFTWERDGAKFVLKRIRENDALFWMRKRPDA